MQTSDLIESLTADLRPMPQRAALLRLALGLGGGAIVAGFIVSQSLGFRVDLASAVLTLSFWRKLLFALAVTGIALSLCMRLGRPEGAPGALPGTLAIPFMVLGVLALIEIFGTPPRDRVEVWLGRTALLCPWIIAGLALPVFAGILWAFRQFAPTRQRLAGFSAGFLAGGIATVVYCIHCPETAASFVVSWYTAGMLLPAMLGLLIGPRVLRW